MRAIFAWAAIATVSVAALARCADEKESKPAELNRSWGPEQATGPPDTTVAGDVSTAWASASPDDVDEWLELQYADAIIPAEIHVYETYNPGSLYKVSGFTKSGMEAELWSGEDPSKGASGIGISKLKLETKLATNRVRIFLRSTAVSGWNEIDTVCIVDAEGAKHWPIAARASTTYAGGDSAEAFVTKPEGAAPLMETPPVGGIDPGPALFGPAPEFPPAPIPDGPPPADPFAPVPGFFPAPAPDPPPADVGPFAPADSREARIRALEEEVRRLREELTALQRRLGAGEK